MDEIQKLLWCALAFLAFQLAVAFASWRLARKKGRDTVGWFLAGLLFGIGAFLLLWLLPGLETPGQTKRCVACGALLPWAIKACRVCGAAAGTPQIDPSVEVKRPLRSCFLVAFLIFFLAVVVLGLIGYFGVPDQPVKTNP